MHSHITIFVKPFIQSLFPTILIPFSICFKASLIDAEGPMIKLFIIRIILFFTWFNCLGFHIRYRLKKMGFITTKSTSKGTIAKLINTELFDPNIEFGNDQINGQLTSKQRTANGQATTNNNCKNSNNWNKRERAHSQNENECNESIPDQTEVIDHGKGRAAIPEWYCKHYHEAKEIRRSWLNGHGKLINWRREIVAWFNKDGKPLRENEHAKSNQGGSRKANATAGSLAGNVSVTGANDVA